MTSPEAPPPDDLDRTRTTHGAGPAQEPVTPARQTPLPASIGHYRILGLLGEGGMGVVYEAEQASPRRVVALKVVRGGQFVDEERVRMFQREAETLARLKHPNIAAIFESGRTEDGQHFFAMELVRGPMLHEHFGRSPVKTRTELVARLELFRTICDAVQYAHQRGVIHRDLKPSNIVVTDEAGRPAVKILDFGLARITESDVAAASRVTEIGIIKGTLAYMSPEQALGNPEEIDARADVYSLGVMLYELLVGKRPHALEKTSIIDAVRVITSEPPPPLRSHSGAAMRIDSDLETITGKALEKEPDRRYASASALSDDVGRYLGSQPILARPPSTMYQLRKAISRNRLASALAGALALLLVGFGVWMSVLYRSAERERTEARRQAKIAVAVNDFLNNDLLGAVNPAAGNTDPDVPMRKLVDLAAERAKGQFADDPLVGAAIRRTLGQTYTGLSLYDKAEPYLRDALTIYTKESGANDAETLRTATLLGALDMERGKFDDAVVRLKAVAENQRRLLGDANPDTLQSLGALAVVYYQQGRLDDAGALSRQVLDAAAHGAGEESEGALAALNTLAMVETDQGKYDQGEKTLKHLIELQRKKMGTDDSFTVLQTRNNLSQLYLEAGRFKDAEPISRDVLERARRVLGNDHKETLTYVNNLAIVARKLDKMDEAETLYREGFEASRRTLGAEAPATIIAMVNLASFYAKAGRCAPNQRFIDETVGMCRKMPPDTPALGFALRNKGECLLMSGHPGEAEPVLLEAESHLEKVFGPSDPKVVGLSGTLAKVYDQLGQRDKADARRATVEAQKPKEAAKP